MKKLIATCLSVLTIATSLSMGVSAAIHIDDKVETDPPPETEITIKADLYDAYYKCIDGKYYLRLWNRTRNRWETDWKYCPDFKP